MEWGMKRCAVVLAGLLLAVSAAAALDDLPLLIEPLSGPDGSTIGAEATEIVIGVFLDSPYFTQVIDQQARQAATTAVADVDLAIISAADARVLASERRQQSDFRSPAATISGYVRRHGEGYQARLRCLAKGGRIIAEVPGESSDYRYLARNLAEVLHAILTGNRGVGFANERGLVTNDNSTVRIEVTLNREPEGDWPVYASGDTMRIRVRSDTDGYVLVLGIGSGSVTQLYPIGRLTGQLKAGQTLDLPTADFAAFGFDPAGFEMFGDEPGYERVHVFFARQPIKTVPDPELKPSRYFAEWLPETFRRALFQLDPQWSGAAARYYYAVKRGATTTTASETRAAPPVEPDEAITLNEVVGAAPVVNGDTKGARDLALLDARRQALEAGLGVMLKSETEVKDFQLVRDQIQLQTQTGYVRIGRVISEKQEHELYYVRVTAQVSRRPLLKAYRESTLPDVLGQLDYPRVLLLFDEQVLGQPNTGSVAESAIRDWLTANQVDVVDPAQLATLKQQDIWRLAQSTDEAQMRAAAAKIGAQVQAELIIRGRVLATHDQVNNPAQARLECLEAIRKATEAMLHGQGDRDRGALFDRLLARWMSHPTTLVLNVDGLNYQQATELTTELCPAQTPSLPQTVDPSDPASYRPMLPLWSHATVRSFEHGLAQLELRSPLRPHRAVDCLLKQLKQRGWQVTSVSQTRLMAKAK